MQVSALEHDVGNDAEHSQRDTLLDDLQLNKIEGTSVFNKADAIGRHLTTIFKKSDTPGEEYHADEGPMAGCARFLKFQMPIPSKRHEDVA